MLVISLLNVNVATMLLRHLIRNFAGVSKQWTTVIEGTYPPDQTRKISTTAIWMGKLEKAKQEAKEKKLILHSDDYFQQYSDQKKNQALFKAAVDCYLMKENVYRRGHVEFVYAALKRMKDFGSAKDLSSYKKIMEVFPKYKMIPKSTWQAEMMHYPKQQQCAIDIMEEMEKNAVIPDNNFGIMLAEVFGLKTHVFRKYQRMMYWMPKMRHLNPYPIPQHLPDDPTYLAVLALKRMCVDLKNEVTVYWPEDTEENPTEQTFIASAQSPSQRELLALHPTTSPLTVEGGFTVWTRQVSQTYFVLFAEPDAIKYPKTEESVEDEDLFTWNVFTEEEKPKGLYLPPSIHEQSDGTVLAMCITGTSSKDSLVMWIRALQRTNPKLQEIPVVFKLKTPETLPDIIQHEDNKNLPTST